MHPVCELLSTFQLFHSTKKNLQKTQFSTPKTNKSSIPFKIVEYPKLMRIGCKNSLSKLGANSINLEQLKISNAFGGRQQRSVGRRLPKIVNI
jgi:hypothetical protein